MDTVLGILAYPEGISAQRGEVSSVPVEDS
jgi:hypothetical protein